MIWRHWLLCVFFVMQAIGGVLLIGERRSPVTKGQALTTVCVSIFWIILLVTA